MSVATWYLYDLSYQNVNLKKQHNFYVGCSFEVLLLSKEVSAIQLFFILVFPAAES